MSKLEELVPPLEMCKCIPEGAFAYSALVFARLFTGHTLVVPREAAAENGWDITDPAPTLEEIMEALPKYDQNENPLACVPDFDGESGIFGGAYAVGYTDKSNVADKSAAAAALKLWLEVRG